MATRRDQLHSYQFLIQRVISAVVMRETDPFQAPLRRGTGAVFAGVMIAVIVAAGFGVYGILSKTGSNNWKHDGSVVIEKESGAVFLYQHDALHPMANYASALLAASTVPNAPSGPDAVFREPANSLAGVTRGVMLGIPGAPNSLPASDKVVGAPWSLCSVPTKDSADNIVIKSTLATGHAPSGGSPLKDSALLAQDSQDGTVYLIWHGYRYPVQQPDLVRQALFQTSNLDKVGKAWLNSLPQGRTIGPISVPDSGKQSAAVPGHANGDLLVDQSGSGPQYWLVYDDGLALITELQKFIEVANNRTPQNISAGEATSLPKSHAQDPTNTDADPPTKAPALVSPATMDAACAMFSNAKNKPEVTVGGSFVGIGAGVASSSQTSGGTSLADLVVVPPGHVAVVRTMASDTAPDGAYDLVTDTGMRFPVPSADVLKVLGYSADKAVSMPTGLVSSIPAGRTLDPANATKPIDNTAKASAN